MEIFDWEKAKQPPIPVETLVWNAVLKRLKGIIGESNWNHKTGFTEVAELSFALAVHEWNSEDFKVRLEEVFGVSLDIKQGDTLGDVVNKIIAAHEAR